ncbi:uncharacterized protein LOC132182025 [Corylus avellana]|uniref:uncharacterized protein LOC132182025 n=1 Tax=Corylus avellana TaxID=13451 RepID=UPI00286C775C|nr:uncharacterized protein LOC132182025 [Corylus avellana]
MGWAKANCDAAIARQHERIGLRVVVRDSWGNMLAAKCVTQDGCLALAVAEAMAFLVAIRLCHGLGLPQVHFEGDAKAVIESVNSGEKDSSWMGHIIEDIKLELRVFQRWQFTFTRREGNHVAHVLAKYAVARAHESCWKDIPPDCIRDAVLLEQASLVS